MTTAQRKKYLATVERLRRSRPGLAPSRYYQLARKRLGICRDCSRPVAVIRADQCDDHLASDVARKARAKRRAKR